MIDLQRHQLANPLHVSLFFVTLSGVGLKENRFSIHFGGSGPYFKRNN